MTTFGRWSIAALVGAAPLLLAFLTPPSASEEAEKPAKSALLGLWQATQPEKEGDPVRFYYFHDGGIGLVRYGRVGLTYTRSFHWKVGADGKLTLVFMKSGEHHRVRYAIEGDRTVLHLPQDPAFPGDHRYRRDVRPRGLDFDASAHPLARLWIQPTKDRRGGQGFRMYQLQPPTIDGRGVGWYHEGDMAEWSTETLTYRRTGESLELHFSLRDERVSTSMKLAGHGAERTLTLESDPRNFWHRRVYRDGGPGFTVALEGLPLPYTIPGHGPDRGLGEPASAGCSHAR